MVNYLYDLELKDEREEVFEKSPDCFHVAISVKNLVEYLTTNRS